jgi:CheY-like chemotaxis protein
MTKKILVADNSITIQKIVAMAFENEDAIVEGVSNGKDALDRMGSFKPDIVLADINMQDLTGFNLSKKIKHDPKFNSTKILLLASDFEDFNKDLFDNSGADDHISKPFKSEDIIKKVVDLISEVSSKSIDKTINLSSMDLDEPIAKTATTISLSADNIIKEEGAITNLSSADLEEPIDPTSVKENTPIIETIKKNEEDTLDEMIKDVESLKKAVVPSDADYDEFSEEVAPTQEDIVGDELDMAFREIANFNPQGKPDNITSIQLESVGGLPALEGIIPEPEDLLKEITSAVIEEKKRMTSPSLREENSSHTSQIFHKNKSQQTTTIQENQNVSGQAKHTLEDMIHASIEKELAEISNSITQSVLEIVREITPKIVREIVKEEIGTIKKP